MNWFHLPHRGWQLQWRTGKRNMGQMRPNSPLCQRNKLWAIYKENWNVQIVKPSIFYSISMWRDTGKNKHLFVKRPPIEKFFVSVLFPFWLRLLWLWLELFILWLAISNSASQLTWTEGNGADFLLFWRVGCFPQAAQGWRREVWWSWEEGQDKQRWTQARFGSLPPASGNLDQTFLIQLNSIVLSK